MTTAREIPVKFIPRGVADTVDGDNSPPGAMTSLQNLLHDPSTPACFVCRPANVVEIDFTGWGAAPGTVGAVTAAYQVDNIIYGLVGITSGTDAGKDYPFAYDVTTSSFLTVSGTITGHIPTSQATSGAWVPPQMTLTGVDLVVTHVGFDGVSNFIGWFDITTPGSPVWHAGNTATNGLPSVPQACGTFNNRTYLVCGSAAYYTDTLAIAMTNSNQSLNIGDATNVTCMAPLPESTVSGITQGLLAFKLDYVGLITGDEVTSNLGLNQISNSVGTGAPRTAVSTPEGVRFMANDGIRNINFFGVLSEPDGDLALPFIYAVVPSRCAACYNADIYRICVQNGNKPGSPYEDYWYKFQRKTWVGPHSFRYDIAIPLLNYFVLASNALIAKMWNSYTVQAQSGAGSSFMENGVSLAFTYETAPISDFDNIYANSVERTTVEIAVPDEGQTYTCIAQDENQSVLSQATIPEPSSATIWGAFLWGFANWGAAQTGLLPITIPWLTVVVCNKPSFLIIGPSLLGFKISKLHLGVKRLNYLLN